MQPYVQGADEMVDSIYNGWRMKESGLTTDKSG
jgi:hypothetical protein